MNFNATTSIIPLYYSLHSVVTEGEHYENPNEVVNNEAMTDGMDNLWKKSSVVIVSLMPLILLFGLLGNSLTVIVYSKPKLRRISINLLIMSLAMLDSGLLLTGVAVFVPLGLYDYLSGSVWGMAYTAYATKFLYPISSMIQMASLYLLCLITVERFIAIRLPFQTRRFCTLRNTKFGIGVVLAFSFAFNVVRFWEYRIFVDENGLSYPEENLRLNKTYALVYTMWLYLLFMFSFPFILLVSLNAIIIQSLKCAVRERSLMVGHEKSTHVSTTVMIVLVIGIFLACNTLPFILSIAENFVANSPLFYFLIDLGNFLVQISAATNPIIYYRYNKLYRKKVREIWSKRTYFCCFCISSAESNKSNPDGKGEGKNTKNGGLRGQKGGSRQRNDFNNKNNSNLTPSFFSDEQVTVNVTTVTAGGGAGAGGNSNHSNSLLPKSATTTNVVLIVNNQNKLSPSSSLAPSEHSVSLLHHHRRLSNNRSNAV